MSLLAAGLIMGALLAGIVPLGAWVFQDSFRPVIRSVLKSSESYAKHLPGAGIRMTPEIIAANASSLVVATPGIILTLVAKGAQLPLEIEGCMGMGAIFGIFFAWPINYVFAKREYKAMKEDESASASEKAD
jgi:hypothetical protein